MWQPWERDGWKPILYGAHFGSGAMAMELLIFWGGRLVARELFRTLGATVRRQMELEPLGYSCVRLVRTLPLAAPAA